MSWDLKDYVDVPARLKMLAEKFPDVRIVEHEPRIITIGDKTFLQVKVQAWRAPDDQQPAIAYCWEPFPGTTPYTRDSEQMNAATSALGRLCAIMLPGAFAKQASANEVLHRAGPPRQARTPVPAVGGPDPWEEQTHDNQIRAIVERERNERQTASANAPATQPQKKMLAATAKRKGLTVAEDLRVFCADTIGRDLVNAKDLTKSEASKVIDALTALPDKQQDN
jgi:hypothetical protein